MEDDEDTDMEEEKQYKEYMSKRKSAPAPASPPSRKKVEIKEDPKKKKKEKKRRDCGRYKVLEIVEELPPDICDLKMEQVTVTGEATGRSVPKLVPLPGMPGYVKKKGPKPGGSGGTGGAGAGPTGVAGGAGPTGATAGAVGAGVFGPGGVVGAGILGPGGVGGVGGFGPGVVGTPGGPGVGFGPGGTVVGGATTVTGPDGQVISAPGGMSPIYGPDGTIVAYGSPGEPGSGVGVSGSGPSGVGGVIGPDGSFVPGGAYGPDGTLGAIAPDGKFVPGGAYGPDGSFGGNAPDGTFVPGGVFAPDGSFGAYRPDGKFSPGSAYGPDGKFGAYGPEAKFIPGAAFGTDGKIGGFAPDGKFVPNGVFGPEGQFGAYAQDGKFVPGGAYSPEGTFGAYGSDGKFIPGGVYGADGKFGAYGPDGTFIPGGAYGADGRFGTYGPDGKFVPGGVYGPDGKFGAYGPDGKFIQGGAYGPDGSTFGAYRPADNKFVPGGVFGPDGTFGAYGADGKFVKGGAYGPEGQLGVYGPGGTFIQGGEIGPEGTFGAYGPDGTFIAGGVYGPSGAYGPGGAAGAPGAPGAAGTPGQPGAPGEAGAFGEPGTYVAYGAPGGEFGTTGEMEGERDKKVDWYEEEEEEPGPAPPEHPLLPVIPTDTRNKKTQTDDEELNWVEEDYEPEFVQYIRPDALDIDLDEEALLEAGYGAGAQDAEAAIKEALKAGLAAGYPEELDQPWKPSKAIKGLFRDGMRRIDYVICFPDEINDTLQRRMQLEYIYNLLKSGLEIEEEHPWLYWHKDQIFLKIHAPDEFLQNYAEAMRSRKFFADDHVTNPEVRTTLERFLSLEHDNENIAIVRKHYTTKLRLSFFERSYIVYMYLRNFPYGVPVHAQTLGMLKRYGLISDHYALHDGPYEFLASQDYQNLTTRQMLFYNWLGVENSITNQPINLIHEYFGAKLGFFFSFYEIYNRMLLFLCLIAFFCTVLQWLMGGEGDPGQVKWYGLSLTENFCTHYNKTLLYACPRCKDFEVCPFRTLGDECLRLKLFLLLGSGAAMIFLFFMCLWSASIYVFWRRTQSYWKWLWEMRIHRPSGTIRFEFDVNRQTPIQSDLTGLLKNYHFWFWRKLRFFISNSFGLGIGITSFLYFALLSFLHQQFSYVILYQIRRMRYRDQLYLAFFTFVTTIFTFAIEKFFHLLSRLLTRLENHRTFEEYEDSLIKKKFSCSVAFNLPWLAYFAWFKGAFYAVPYYFQPMIELYFLGQKYNYEFNFLGNLVMDNCGILQCTDEIFIVFSVTFIFRQLFVRALRFSSMWCMITDTNISSVVTRVVPDYERQRVLHALKEEEIIDHMNELMLQLLMLGLFTHVFPLAPFIAMAVNMTDSKFQAKKYLLGCRRATLVEREGIGSWNGVLICVCIAPIILNGISVVRHTKLMDGYVYYKFHQRDLYMRDFFFFVTTPFRVKDYSLSYDANELFKRYNGTKPRYCYFPGYFIKTTWNQTHYYNLTWPFTWYNISVNYETKSDLQYKREKFYVSLMNTAFPIAFMNLGLVCLCLMIYYVPVSSGKTADILHKERTLKNAYFMQLKNEDENKIKREKEEEERQRLMKEEEEKTPKKQDKEVGEEVPIAPPQEDYRRESQYDYDDSTMSLRRMSDWD